MTRSHHTPLRCYTLRQSQAFGLHWTAFLAVYGICDSRATMDASGRFSPSTPKRRLHRRGKESVKHTVLSEHPLRRGIYTIILASELLTKRKWGYSRYTLQPSSCLKKTVASCSGVAASTPASCFLHRNPGTETLRANQTDGT